MRFCGIAMVPILVFSYRSFVSIQYTYHRRLGKPSTICSTGTPPPHAVNGQRINQILTLQVDCIADYVAKTHMWANIELRDITNHLLCSWGFSSEVFRLLVEQLCSIGKPADIAVTLLVQWPYISREFLGLYNLRWITSSFLKTSCIRRAHFSTRGSCWRSSIANSCDWQVVARLRNIGVNLEASHFSASHNISVLHPRISSALSRTIKNVKM